MGWAKYYEDNISIYNGRLALLDQAPLTYEGRMRLFAEKPICKAKSVTQKNAITRNERRGLELRFLKPPEKSTTRKLQINGWWWSNAYLCWCTYNTQANREYAKAIIQCFGAEITIVR